MATLHLRVAIANDQKWLHINVYACCAVFRVYRNESNKQFTNTQTNKEMSILKVYAYNTNYDSAFDAQMSFLMGCSRAYNVISEIYTSS